MCTPIYPFDGENICKLYENIARAEYTIPEHVSDHLQQLIKGSNGYNTLTNCG